MQWLSDPDVWSAFAALLLLEIVFGVDNVVFISILAAKLPKDQQAKARRTGLIAAGAMRVVLLLFVGWIVTLDEDLFDVFDVGFSGKDLVLLSGGVFLIYKATNEIHHRLEGVESHDETKTATTFGAVIVQVLILDAVFSIDSVITAVGMTKYVGVMVAAVMISVGIMLVASKAIYEFVNKHPTVKMLALSFPLLDRSPKAWARRSPRATSMPPSPFRCSLKGSTSGPARRPRRCTCTSRTSSVNLPIPAPAGAASPE